MHESFLPSYPGRKKGPASLRKLVMALSLATFSAACSDPPPPGLDLLQVACSCVEDCSSMIVPVGGEVCTDASVPENVDDAGQFICDEKETIGFNVCKLENCIPITSSPIPGGCPSDNGEFAAGDFGQALAHAVPPSMIRISGDDINAFDIEPESFVVETTRGESTLFFGSFVADLVETQFTSDGIFGDDDHTLAQGHLTGEPFTVALQPDGSFTIPPGTGNFIVTGLIDGDRLSLSIDSISLQGLYDEAAGVFELYGMVEAQGADIDIDVDVVFQFDNRPPRAHAGPDQSIECDSTALEGTAQLSGNGSTDPDGVADIVSYAWIEANTPLASGKDVEVALSLGTHQITLGVADQRGSFSEDGVTIAVADTTAPSIDIQEPTAIEYPHSATIVLDYAVNDGCTGVASVTPLLDGADMLAGHGLADGQEIDLLTELALGTHDFSVTAVDAEGNESTAQVTFSIVVTPESIQDAVTQLWSEGRIDRNAPPAFLLGRLIAAARQFHGGNCRAAAGIYRAFINTLRAQEDKAIDAGAAGILEADAQYLIEHCVQGM